MRRVTLAELEPGMVVARDVADGRGGLLLRRGIALSPAYIRALEERGFAWVYISDEAADLLVVEDVVASYAANSCPAVLAGLHALCEPDGGPAGVGQATVDQEAGDVACVLSQTLAPNVVTGLARLLAADQTLLYHSLATTVTAISFGFRLGLDEASLRSLTTGCLLHDCGKTLLSEHVLLLPQLSDEQLDELKRHPLLGLQMARELGLADQQVLLAIGQHHERQDGAGYPRGLRGTNRIAGGQQSGRVSLVAEVTAIADVYSMLAVGSIRHASLPPKGIRLALRRMAGTVLNRQLVQCFLSRNRCVPVGATAYVSGGRYKGCRGLVVRRSPVDPGSVVMRLTQGPAGIWMQPLEIDLAEEAEAGVGVVLE